MIKNEANRVIRKQTETTATNPVRQSQRASKIVNDNDNRRSPSPPPKHRPSERDEDAQPLSKLDIIKKFDNKVKRGDSSGEQVPKRGPLHAGKTPDADHPKNDNGLASNSGDHIYASQTDGALARNRNDSENGNTCGNAVPPKPLPRTSRNNSISSLSSEQGNTEESTGPRPVAKPRTTASSYKVYLYLFISIHG